jgi:hypothetical protein
VQQEKLKNNFEDQGLKSLVELMEKQDNKLEEFVCEADVVEKGVFKGLLGIY